MSAALFAPQAPLITDEDLYDLGERYDADPVVTLIDHHAKRNAKADVRLATRFGRLRAQRNGLLPA